MKLLLWSLIGLYAGNAWAIVTDLNYKDAPLVSRIWISIVWPLGASIMVADKWLKK